MANIEAVAEQIDGFLNCVRLISENQREILFGNSGDIITTTQGHILMLLAQNGPQTNTQLAGALEVTAAAVTKAVKGLYAEPNVYVTPVADEQDGRVIRWTITASGGTLASEHARCHRETIEEYQQILADFSADEQQTITKFMTQLETKLRQENAHGKK
ncbi:MarR family transcriptional regulator [Weissella diestrammenae]|uniref:MarR family transcriptional regulator n=1 Tax=Weissella diestrammenae TaxID=1162633 RepID=A0A7G9T735_9LACO|nr:MarR family transcriptional regulator [Weissella diestrammenae]MCM0582492.1 MarR family transcriptional regulator [Weissella diestrammenae]QNN75910.1 MarR family transcriptional regulator [Weissella diestrammenae]